MSASVGRVEWIGVRPGRGQPMIAKEKVEAIGNRGLVEDHKSGRTGGRRQVTLIQQEHFAAIGKRVHATPVPERLRRNLVISGIELQVLIGQQFRVGEAILEGTGTCEPCHKMDDALGEGGCAAMAGMGGITARILQSGEIRIGDEVVSYSPPIAVGSAICELF